MQALTADSSRAALERNGIQLISFRELTGDSRAGLNFGAVH